jgi:hypothetical protein
MFETTNQIYKWVYLGDLPIFSWLSSSFHPMFSALKETTKSYFIPFYSQKKHPIIHNSYK